MPSLLGMLRDLGQQLLFDLLQLLDLSIDISGFLVNLPDLTIGSLYLLLSLLLLLLLLGSLRLGTHENLFLFRKFKLIKIDFGVQLILLIFFNK